MSMVKEDRLQDHLARLAGDEWAIWRWAGLRSAGLPGERLQELTSLECAEAADAYLAAEHQARQIQQGLLQKLRPRMRECDPDQRRLLRRVHQQIEQGKLPDSSLAEAAGVDLADLQQSSAVTSAALATFEQVFAEALPRSISALERVARDSSFRLAVTWQNRQALRRAVDIFLSKSGNPGQRSFKQRQREALITSYIQRYCAKNDTIGFFGPVAWAQIVDHGDLVKIEPGTSLLARREVYFENWCIDKLAEALARDLSLRPWLIPRRLPQVYVEGTQLYLPLTPPLPLSPAHAAVLLACDGQQTARQLATQLLQRNLPGLSNEADVFEVLQQLQTRRRIAWTLEIAGEDLYPEKSLRRQLMLIEDDRLRTAALASLSELEAGKQAVARAAAHPRQLEQALEALDNTFTRITAAEATRHAGEMYAGRTLVYEDCLRDLRAEIGPELARSLGEPLALMLTSARWYIAEAFTLYREAFQTIYEQLVARTGSSIVAFTGFWLYSHALLFDDHHPLLATLRERLQERWQALVTVPASQRQVHLRVDALRQRVLDIFALPADTWMQTCYHSPDVMLASSSLEDLQSGRYQWILGEIHPGVNTLQPNFFLAQHPRPHELLQAVSRDCPRPRIQLVPPKEALNARMSNAFVSSTDWRFVFAHDTCHLPADRTIPLGELLLERHGRELIARTRQGDQSWNILELLGEFILLRAVHGFDPFRVEQHMPRINFDRLVVHRESWHFLARNLEFTRIEREAERFLAVRRWKQQSGLPSRVFLKTPTERKPVYTDFASLPSIDVFIRVLRRLQNNNGDEDTISITEMLPDIHQSWLIDSQNQHFTSEFRFVVIDRQQEKNPGVALFPS